MSTLDSFISKRKQHQRRDTATTTNKLVKASINPSIAFIEPQLTDLSPVKPSPVLIGNKSSNTTHKKKKAVNTKKQNNTITKYLIPNSSNNKDKETTEEEEEEEAIIAVVRKPTPHADIWKELLIEYCNDDEEEEECRIYTVRERISHADIWNELLNAYGNNDEDDGLEIMTSNKRKNQEIDKIMKRQRIISNDLIYYLNEYLHVSTNNAMVAPIRPPVRHKLSIEESQSYVSDIMCKFLC
ncbi:hypothetical protein BCV72DRAFT_5390 [Rhizopus microsporus var. microsporus]|uniref:Uncharacterized protein n=1 Tax=Rhizopus microsporus var. microsporus TaxID=86635 RepID=A0A1X0QZ97_RHIZD|nr:hypothetical protein BCV72DRAFT_5390 [Rhizopus microsporus var. microsporus]